MNIHVLIPVLTRIANALESIDRKTPKPEHPSLKFTK